MENKKLKEYLDEFKDDAALHVIVANPQDRKIYVPYELNMICDKGQKDPVLCIEVAYAAIVRAQRIAYVKDQADKTVEKVEEKDGNVIGEKWEVQQAWDKQENFLKAQARAQGELRAMIKQYDEMLHKDWEAASEEQKARIEQIRTNTARMSGGNGDEDEGVEIINDAPEETGPDIGDHNSEVSADI